MKADKINMREIKFIPDKIAMSINSENLSDIRKKIDSEMEKFRNELLKCGFTNWEIEICTKNMFYWDWSIDLDLLDEK